MTDANNVKIIPTLCHGCGAAKPRCAILCHVKDGKLIRVEGNPAASNNWGPGCTSLCAKGNTGMQFLYAPNRLQDPMKRTGKKGEGKFQRITWDEALDAIAGKLKETKEKYGPESYAVLSPEYWPVLATLGRRFLNVYGSPNYLHSAICATPRAAAAKVTIGFSSYGPGDWGKTNLFVNWGGNCENATVNQGQPYEILNALERGMQYIDIRPMLEPLGAKAHMWLPVRPGTDSALALAILNVIIGQDLYDRQFVEKWCHGFDKLAEHVKQFTPLWAEKRTGIPAGQIIKAATAIASVKPCFIKIGNGVGDQTSDGTATVQAICLIAAITGNLDVNGGFYAGKMPPPIIKTNPVSTLENRISPEIAEKLVAPESPVWYQKAGNWDQGPTSAYYKAIMSILTGKPYPIRVLNASCSNPLSATRNPRLVVEALRKLDFFFVMDIYHAPHVDYADIVLPACTSYESSDQIEVKRRPEGDWIGIYNKVVEPSGESRSDWQFYLDLAVKVGYGQDFWNGSMEALLAEQLEPSGITAEELRKSPTGIFKARTQPLPATAPEERRYTQLFKNLPHGKVQCYNEFTGGKPDNTGEGILPYLPEYAGPPEGINETPELAKEYPLILSDIHAHRLSQHSYFHDIPYLREKQPYPWVRLNPATAKKYGIKKGDWVKVESPHGWSKFVAEPFEGIAPEVLMTKRGWWQACPELGLPGYDFADGGSEPNNLYNTDPRHFDKFYSQMPKQTLVKISKLEDASDAK